MADYTAQLTPAQRRAVTTLDGPLLVVAGPGSGKTRVITCRVAHLVEAGVPPWNILCLTFTNKAAEEMSTRVEAMVGRRGVWTSTFHSLCNRLLRKDLEAEGYSRDYSIYDRTDQLSALKSVLRELNLDAVEYGLGRLPGRIGHAKNRCETPETFRKTEPVFSRIFEAYQEALRRNNALDFDDLLSVFLSQIRTRPELLSEYQDRFRYVLVDEYQDTNRLQYDIVRLLTASHGNICVTGDPDQSIYRWRGADIRNILDFRREYPEARTVLLEENFRSAGRILEAAGALIAHNRQREEKKLVPVREEGRLPRIVQAFDPEDEAIRVTDEIHQLLAAGIPAREISVFYRTNAQSRTLESALLDGGVPYVIVGSVEFYHRKEVRDLLAYLRLAANPRDDVSFLRVHNLPPRGIGARSLDRIRARARDENLCLLDAARALAVHPSTASRLRRALETFSGVVSAIADFDGQGVHRVLRHALRVSGYAAWLEETGDDTARDRLENLAELERACEEWDEKHPGGDLAAFLEEVTLLSDVDRWDRKQAVSLMTLHSSKGLEFDAVLMVGLEEGLLPHFGPQEVDEDPDRLEEERRLCFVGMTRARDRLVLSWAKNRRTVRGEIRFGSPSRFLEEAGLAERLSERTASRMAARPVPTVEAAQPFRTGDLVQHLKLGRGRVVAYQGIGAKAKVIIEFPGKGLKTFAVDLAPIVRVSDE